ncbi:hypothetical protein ACOSP7_018658 [Xanthoceras sorbifolium]
MFINKHGSTNQCLTILLARFTWYHRYRQTFMASSASTDSATSVNINKTMASPSTSDLNAIAKTLTFNVSLKLDRSNYIHWKTPILPAIRAMDLEGLISSSTQGPDQFIEVYSVSATRETIVNQQINQAFMN